MCVSTGAGVREVRKSDVRPLSRVRPEDDADQSEEERRARGTLDGDDGARPTPQRRRRSAVRAHDQLHPPVGDRRQRDVRLHGE